MAPWPKKRKANITKKRKKGLLKDEYMPKHAQDKPIEIIKEYLLRSM